MTKRPPIAEEATVETEPDKHGRVVEVWIYPRRVRCWPPPGAAKAGYPPGVYRIAYYDETGKRRNGTSKTAVDADERCQRLSSAAARGAFKSLRQFGTYLDEWEAAHLEDQAPRNREATVTTLRYLREHGPVQVPCAELTPGSFSKVFKVAAKTRNDGGLDQLRRSVNTILSWGDRERYFPDVPTIDKKSLPKSSKAAGGRDRIREAGEAEGTLRRDEVASHEAVRDLADAFAEHYGQWWAALGVYLAAYGGVRYGELMALTSQRLVVPGHESWDEHPHTLRVWWQVTELGKTAEMEHGTGRRYFAPPKGSKRRWAYYLPETPLGVDLDEMVTRRVDELDDDPDALLFPSLGSEGVENVCPRTGDRIVGAFTEGKTWRRHVDLAIEDIDGWPAGETWHSLRDVYAVTLIDDLEMQPGDAILNTGHENASTFWDRYYGTRAAGVEERTAAQAQAAIERWRAAR